MSAFQRRQKKKCGKGKGGVGEGTNSSRNGRYNTISMVQKNQHVLQPRLHCDSNKKKGTKQLTACETGT